MAGEFYIYPKSPVLFIVKQETFLMAGEFYIYPADVAYDMIPKSDYEIEQDRQKKLAKQAKAVAEAEMKVNEYDNSERGFRDLVNYVDRKINGRVPRDATDVEGYLDRDAIAENLDIPEDMELEPANDGTYDVNAILAAMSPTEQENFENVYRVKADQAERQARKKEEEDAAYLDYMANKDKYQSWEKADPNAEVVRPLSPKAQKFFDTIDDLALGYDPREGKDGYEYDESDEPSALEEMSYFMPIIGDKVYARRVVSDMASGRRVPGALDWLSILGTGVGIGSGIYAGKKFLNWLRARRYMKLPETLKLKGPKTYENVPVFNANGTMSDASFYNNWYNTLERFKPRKKYSDTYNGQPIVGDFDQYGVPVR